MKTQRPLPGVRSCLAIIAVLLLFSDPTRAATLLLHYDVNDPLSWNGSTLQDLQGFGATLTPTNGNPRSDNIPPAVTATDFGAPTYSINGATSPVAPPPGDVAISRAYLDFTKLGLLTGPSTNRDQTIFDVGLTTGGYTLEGFFLMRTGYLAAENTGIGFSQDTNGENQLIRVPRGTNSNLFSNSAVDAAAGGPQSLTQVDQNINGIIPRDQWFHFVKVHDTAAGEVRYYINGALQPSMTQSLASSVEYHAFDLQYGNVGGPFREIRGVGYSMFRAYVGALTPSEIEANFLQVAFVPEPSSATLCGLGCAMLIRLRRRRS